MNKKILIILVSIIMIIAYFDMVDCFRKIEATTSKMLNVETKLNSEIKTQK